MIIKSKADLAAIKKAYHKNLDSVKYHVTVCGGGSCVSSGCIAVRDTVLKFMEENKLNEKAGLTFTGCMGLLRPNCAGPGSARPPTGPVM